MLPTDPRTDVAVASSPPGQPVAADDATVLGPTDVAVASPADVPADVAAPVVPAQRQDERNGRDERTRACFAETLTCSPERRRALLDEIVTLHMGVARSIAVRYRERGVALDDLVQVAYLGLTKAARGFDPEHGGTFLAYAVPTITGEVRRYFRDHAWQVRPPRRIQELQAEISRVRADAMRAGNASPTVSELVAKLDADPDTVIEALGADGCFQPAALDMPNDEGHTLADVLGMDDAACRELDTHLMLLPAIRRLCDRDRHVLGLRFFQDWTQEQIARDIGVTQMQVSRILTRILATLRRELSETGTGGDLGGTAVARGRGSEGTPESGRATNRRGARAA
jgi:RNA polymerase sigma-B factor